MGDRAEPGLGVAIRQLRIGARMNQSELAERSGVERSYINMLENGKRSNASYNIIASLAKSLGVPASRIYREAELPVPEGLADDERIVITSDPEKARPMRRLERLPVPMLNFLERVARAMEEERPHRRDAALGDRETSAEQKQWQGDSMATATTQPLVTADDLWSIPDPPGSSQYELVRGVLVEASLSSTRSNEVAIEVARRIGNHVREHKLGRFGGCEGGFTLQRGPDTVRAPDVWFVRGERVPAGRMPDRFFEGVPDLAVEVLSPSDRQGEIWRRIADYVDAGTPLIWVLDPKTESAVALPHDEMPVIIPADGVLDGGDILPGFVLPLRDVFGI